MYRSDTVAFVERRRALEAELDDVRRHESELRRRSLQVIQDIAVVSPCREPWRRMTRDPRDSRIRHCRRCRKDVYDLSEFDAVEVESLVRHNGELCGRIHRRFDGTIVTADCPSPLVFEGPRCRPVLAAWFVILAALGLLRLLSSQKTLGGVGFRDTRIDRAFAPPASAPSDPASAPDPAASPPVR